MESDRLPRKLTAILYADVAGYSRLTGEDEEGTHRRLSEYLDHLSGAIEEHHGRVVHYAGDAVLADFDTVTDALACAVAIQSSLRTSNRELAAERRVEFRIGINLGEVIVDRDDIYGDGVNVAARLEALAEAGGICVSEAARTAAGRKLAVGFEFLGEREVKNISEPVRAYRVVPEPAFAGEIVDTRPRCPYPGMVPFRAEDEADFHGRDTQIERMVGLLRGQRFMIVIGPSGSGKSSLVRAGLLPKLARSRYFEPGFWLIREMRPGPRPTEVLARLLGRADDDAPFAYETVQGLLDAHPPAKRLLLLVDQFEEVFTQAERGEGARFIGALQGIRSPENCALVLTLRADFYPELMESYLWPVDPSQRVEVAPLRGEALREAIERPAADAGVRLEESLIERLLADAADEPGVLPLLQETMRLLWEEMERRVVPYGAYDRLSRQGAGTSGRGPASGLSAAIAMKADATLAELTSVQQAMARRTFLRLIQFGEGRADTRRQQPLSALRAGDDDEGLFEHTLEHLTDHRLLTRAGVDEPGSAAVDIAHESLITGWTRLRGWAEERREADQNIWSAPFSPDGKLVAVPAGKGAVHLWRPDEPHADPVAISTAVGFWITEMAFSPDGTMLAVAGMGPEDVVHLKDLTNPETPGHVLRGHEGLVWSVTFSADGSRLASAGRDGTVRLWDRARPDAPPILVGRHQGAATRVRFMRDGKHLASSGKDRMVRVWDLERPGRPVAILEAHESTVWNLLFSRDGSKLLTGGGSPDRTVRLWDMTHPVNTLSTKGLADLVCEKVWRNLSLDEWHEFVGADIPYERTCPNLPIHPSLIEAAGKKAKAGDVDGAVALLHRANRLQPDLGIDPEAEATRLATKEQ